MRTVLDAGKVTTIDTLSKLINICTGFGNRYNPARATLQLLQLKTCHEAAILGLEDHRTASAYYTSITKEREILFNRLRPQSTRVVNALEACGAPDEIIESVRSIIRILNGKRVTPLPEPETDPAPGAEAVKIRTTKQQTYVERAEAFAKLIALVQTQESYNPNEADLSLPSLLALYNEMVAMNNTVAQAEFDKDRTMMNLIDRINNPINGVYISGTDSKKYIKSAFGAASAEYKMVRNLRFRKY